MRGRLLAATALTTTVLFLVPGVAFAQTAFDWTGGYFGGTLGGVYSETPFEIDDAPTPLYSWGGTLGVDAGYNWQLDNGLVLGIEGDASISSVSGTRSFDDDNYDADLTSLLSLRGKLGIEVGDALIYGTAGLAAGNVDYTVAINASDPEHIPAEASDLAVGAIGGVGVEMALTDNITVKTEGLAYQLSAVEGVGDNGKGGTYETSYAPSGVTVRSGINFHF